MKNVIAIVYECFRTSAPEDKKEIEHKNNILNLLKSTNAISDSGYNPNFAGNRSFIKDHIVTGRANY